MDVLSTTGIMQSWPTSTRYEEMTWTPLQGERFGSPS